MVAAEMAVNHNWLRPVDPDEARGGVMDDAVELADLIWQLRHELSRAMWGGENKDLRFKAEAVELELQVGVEKARDPGVRVKFWVFDAGGNSRSARTVTQTIRLRLQPIRPADPDQPAIIAGDSVEDED